MTLKRTLYCTSARVSVHVIRTRPCPGNPSGPADLHLKQCPSVSSLLHLSHIMKAARRDGLTPHAKIFMIILVRRDYLSPIELYLTAMGHWFGH